MSLTTENDLYARGVATALASWEAYARGSAGAAVMYLEGVSAAVFPSGPERAVYNNAVLGVGLGSSERAAAVDALTAAYAAAGVDRYAAWVHESDEGMRAELSGRGFTIAGESTRAMGMSLDEIFLPRPEAEIGLVDWPDYMIPRVPLKEEARNSAICSYFACRRRDSNPRHADNDSAAPWLYSWV